MRLTDDQLGALPLVLGELLRAERKNRGWTRKQLRAAMFPNLAGPEGQADADLDNALSLQTLAAWESGSRNILVGRFVHVCAALDVPPGDLLRRALEQLLPADATGAILLDRAGLEASIDPRLHRLKQWAASQNQQRQPESGEPAGAVVELPREALGPLAALSRITTSELVRALSDLVIERS